MIMRKVAVVGIGCTKLGEHWEKSLRDLSTESGALALKDAQVEGKEIEALFIGNMSAGRFVGQAHLAALAAVLDSFSFKRREQPLVAELDENGVVTLKDAPFARLGR